MMSLVSYTCHRVTSALINNCDNRQQGCPFIILGTGLIHKDKYNSCHTKLKEGIQGSSFFFLKNVVRITLGESHNEDKVDADESEEVAHDHPVNHHDERPDRLEAPAEEQKVRRGRQHHHDRQYVFDLVRADKSQKWERQQDTAREQKHHARWRRRLKNRARDNTYVTSIVSW